MLVSVGQAAIDTARTVAHESIVRLCASGLAPMDLLEQVAGRLRMAVPYAGAGWLLTDPATLLGSGGWAEGHPPDMCLSLSYNEILDEDFAKFSAITRLPRPVLRLSEATGGELERSLRHRTIYAPGGLDDELRVVFQTGRACWGEGCLSRGEGDPHFTEGDEKFIAGISAHVGQGLRAGLLIEACQNDTGMPEAPGMVVLRDDDSVESLTDDALEWLGQIPRFGLEVPVVLYAVAKQARVYAETGRGSPPRARVRLPSGRWLLIHGARLRGADGALSRTAVVLEAPRPPELASIIVELHGLTEREQQITQRLLRGESIREIAKSLWISHYTVQDHVKAIFAKVGVKSRPELSVKLFYDHFLPGLIPVV